MLSNIFRHAPRPDAAQSGVVERRAARADEVRAALRVLLSTAGRLAGDAQVADFLRFAVNRSIDLGDLWVAIQGGQVAWAVLPMRSPGRTVLLLLPDTAADPAIAAALVNDVCTHFAGRGFAMAQVMLDPGVPVAATIVDHCGFRLIAELNYLEVAVRTAEPVATPGIRWQTYSPAAHAAFARTLSRTYEGSDDCPALNGLRDIEDVIAGHKATGEFHHDLWMLACDAATGEPMGLLLLAPLPEQRSVEVVYLGVCPTARGRGLGRMFVRSALAMAKARGADKLTLAVDAANAAALRLYYAHGMRHVASRLALVRTLEVAPPDNLTMTNTSVG